MPLTLKKNLNPEPLTLKPKPCTLYPKTLKTKPWIVNPWGSLASGQAGQSGCLKTKDRLEAGTSQGFL